MMRQRRGVALMLVLWLVVVIGASVAVAVVLSRSQGNALLSYRSRLTARMAAESGIELGLAALDDAFGAAASGQDRASALRRVRSQLGSESPHVLGDGRFLLEVEDLTGRIPINTADYATLVRLFGLTAGPDRAPALTAALLDWIDPDDRPRPSGAEAAQYAALGSPFRPPNRPLRRVEELARIHGMDTALAAVLENNITLSGSGLININSAPPLALAAATGMDLATAEKLAAMRTNPFVSIQEVRSAMGGQGGFIPVSLTPRSLLLVSRGWEAGRPHSLEIRVTVELRQTAGARRPRLFIVGWEERDL